MEVAANENRRWGFWGTLIWSAVVMTAFVLLQLGTFGLYVSLEPTGDGVDPGQEMLRLQYDGDLIATATLLTAFLCAPLVVGIVKLRRGSRLADYLPYTVPPRRTLLRWLGILGLFIAASDITSWLTGNPIVPEFMRRVYASADSKPLLWAALILAAPLFEEVFFRGFMLSGILRSRVGAAGAVALTALAWAALHVQYDWYGIGAIIVLGVLLGTARLMTGTLFVPFLLHAAANAFATLETIIVLNGP